MNNKISELLEGAGSLFSLFPSNREIKKYARGFNGDRKALISDMYAIQQDAIKAVNMATKKGTASNETAKKSNGIGKK